MLHAHRIAAHVVDDFLWCVDTFAEALDAPCLGDAFAFWFVDGTVDQVGDGAWHVFLAGSNVREIGEQPEAPEGCAASAVRGSLDIVNTVFGFDPVRCLVCPGEIVKGVLKIHGWAVRGIPEDIEVVVSDDDPKFLA